VNDTSAAAVEPAGAVAAGRSGADGPAGDTPLKRGISPRLLTLFMLGNIVGAGIYVLVGTVADEVGGAVWVSFAWRSSFRRSQQPRTRNS
jgi:hypothetical protein